MDSLELLNLLDVIKNEELYTKRLTELRDAEKALGEARFIAATVEQANKFRNDADKVQKAALEFKERIEAELTKKREDVNKELNLLRAAVELEKQRAKEEHMEAQRLLQVQRELRKKNEEEREALKKYDTMLVNKEADMLRKFRDFQSRLAQAKEILGQE